MASNEMIKQLDPLLDMFNEPQTNVVLYPERDLNNLRYTMSELFVICVILLFTHAFH